MVKIIILTVIMLAIFPLLVYGAQVGETAPAFELQDLQGRTISLKDFRGKVVLLNFWAPWCRSCKALLPGLEALYAKYHKAGLEVISIGLNISEAGAKKLLQKIPLSFQVLLDSKEKTADSYRFSGLPASFIIGRDRAIKYRHMGFGKEFLSLYEKEVQILLNNSNN